MVFRGNFEEPTEVQWLEESSLRFPLKGKPLQEGLWGAWTLDRSAEVPLLALEEQLGPRLLAPEVWRLVLEHACILISSAISGGTFRQRVEEALAEDPDRCWLLLEPMSHAFPLPCPDGCGTELSRDELDAVLRGKRTFFSPDLCCRYAWDRTQGRMLLFDTRETLEQKIDLAREAGFCGVVRREALY